MTRQTQRQGAAVCWGSKERAWWWENRATGLAEVRATALPKAKGEAMQAGARVAASLEGREEGERMDTAP